MTYSKDLILHGERTRWEENFYRVDRAPVLLKVFVTRPLTSDLLTLFSCEEHKQTDGTASVASLRGARW